MCFPAYHHGPMPKAGVVPQRRRDLAGLRRVRDRIDREYARPLDVEALAHGVHMAAGELSREFQRAYGESPYRYLMARRLQRATATAVRHDTLSPDRSGIEKHHSSGHN
jgi:AraC-like DNA-binding protein